MVVGLVCVAFVVVTWAPLRIFIGVYCSAMHACTMYRLLRGRRRRGLGRDAVRIAFGAGAVGHERAQM